ncbi:MAG: hypothetical protein ISR58_14510 [Anaerolineales bacterium]|nr:hypothetical protein [Chloroflexota bacterium]MBL6982389.1 hypothetical protein [Anaerolineales bacterium]
MTSAVSGQPSAVAQRRYPQWVWVFAIAVIVVTSIPYLLSYAVEGTEWQFTGFVFGVEDGNSYMAKMLRGADGDWLFRSPYTALPQLGVLAFFPYLLLGKLTSPPEQHIQLVALFQIFRIGAGILYILASYDFVILFVKTERWRRWGVTLIALGGGLGWLLILLGKSSWLGSLPLDMYSPETFGFLMLLGLPHLSLARALLLWGLRAFLFPNLAPWKSRPGLFTGVLWLLMGLLQPLIIVLAWGIVASHWGILLIQRLWQRWKNVNADANSIKWREWLQRWLWIVSVTAPIVIYTAWAFNVDPVLKQWTAQNLILSPHPLHYLAAYGLMIPFAIAGGIRLVKDKVEAHWLPIAWSIALPFLLYAPYPLQRRLAEGYWVALVILALVYFDRGKRKYIPYFQWLLGIVFPTTLILLLGSINAVRSPQIPIFRPRSEVTAFEYLDEIAHKDTIVLASYETSNALPAWAPVFVVIGHGPESVGLAELSPRVAQFYDSSTLDAERLALLEEFDVDYVFWSPLERELGDWNPEQSDMLTEIYSKAGYSIYQVNY